MRRKFDFRLLSLTLLLTIAVQENVSGQSRNFSDACWLDVRITQSGKPVAVRIADPFARLDQERALLQFLNEPHTYGWDSQTTVADIGRDVGKHIALQIDHRALEEIGLTADALVFAKSFSSAKAKRSARTPTEDPFADHSLESPATLVTSESTGQHWWDRNPTTTTVDQLTNAAVLFDGLSNVDLVIASWSGRWLIITEEAAEENLSTRLYDITPIADIQDSPRSDIVPAGLDLQSSGFGPAMISPGDALMDVVQSAVDPHTWERLGGPSTCCPVVISGRTWLVLSAPVTTHWKVHALLNQLNGS